MLTFILRCYVFCKLIKKKNKKKIIKKKKKKELKHVSEIDIYLFIDKEMRGGISYMTKKCSKKIINTCNHMRIKSIIIRLSIIELSNIDFK